MASTILNQQDEDKCWSFYCASVANPMSDTGSFDEFREMLKIKDSRDNQQSEEGVDSRQMQKQLDDANEILSRFTIPIEGKG